MIESQIKIIVSEWAARFVTQTRLKVCNMDTSPVVRFGNNLKKVHVFWPEISAQVFVLCLSVKCQHRYSMQNEGSKY